MVVATDLSARKELLSTQDTKRAEALLTRLELPISLDTDREKMIDDSVS